MESVDTTVLKYKKKSVLGGDTVDQPCLPVSGYGATTTGYVLVSNYYQIKHA
jgi:hypothetical protein